MRSNRWLLMLFLFIPILLFSCASTDSRDYSQDEDEIKEDVVQISQRYLIENGYQNEYQIDPEMIIRSDIHYYNVSFRNKDNMSMSHLVIVVDLETEKVIDTFFK